MPCLARSCLVPVLLAVSLLGLSACTKWEEKFVNKYRAGSDPAYMDELRALLRQQGAPYIDDKEGGIAFRPVDRPKFDEALWWPQSEEERREAERRQQKLFADRSFRAPVFQTEQR